MTTVTGGLRNRLIERSLTNHIRAGMNALGWFDPGRQHQPVSLVARQHDIDEEVPLNTVAVVVDDIQDTDVEIGSNLAEHRIDIWVDVYAESDSLGAHIADDVRDMLGGRLAGYTDPSFLVTDLTNVGIFTVEIEELRRRRARGFPHPWQRHWFTVSGVLLDTYDGEND